MLWYCQIVTCDMNTYFVACLCLLSRIMTGHALTLPETHIAPKNGLLEDSFPFGVASWQVRTELLVSGSVHTDTTCSPQTSPSTSGLPILADAKGATTSCTRDLWAGRWRFLLIYRPRSLTAKAPEKWMVGRLLSYWEGLFSGAMLNFGGVFGGMF